MKSQTSAGRFWAAFGKALYLIHYILVEEDGDPRELFLGRVSLIVPAEFGLR